MPLHADETNAEGPHHLRLRADPIDHQLAGVQPETLQIALGMREHRQTAVEIVHCPVPLAERHEVVDRRRIGRENRKKQGLRHLSAPGRGTLPPASQSATVSQFNPDCFELPWRDQES
jgi:hypothetical protein